MNCAKPPKENARGTTAGTASGGRSPALIALSTTVVKPNAARPSGAGFASFAVGEVSGMDRTPLRCIDCGNLEAGRGCEQAGASLPSLDDPYIRLWRLITN